MGIRHRPSTQAPPRHLHALLPRLPSQLEKGLSTTSRNSSCPGPSIAFGWMQALSWWWWWPWSSSQVSRRTSRSALASMRSSPAPESLAWHGRAFCWAGGCVPVHRLEERVEEPGLGAPCNQARPADEATEPFPEESGHDPDSGWWNHFLFQRTPSTWLQAWQGHRLCSPGLSLPDMIMYTVGSRPNYFLNGDRV